MSKISDYFKEKRIERMARKAQAEAERWEARRPLLQQRNRIEKEKKELQVERNKIKFPSWSKLFLIFLFVNFSLLEGFVAWVTIKSFSVALSIGMMPDFSPLITLLGAILGETISYGIYSAKAKAENTAGGVVYDSAMNNREECECGRGEE